MESGHARASKCRADGDGGDTVTASSGLRGEDDGLRCDGTAHYVYLSAGEGPLRHADDTVLVAAPIAGGAERRQSLQYFGLETDAGEEKDPRRIRIVREAARRDSISQYGDRLLARKYVEFNPPLVPGRHRIWIEGTYSRPPQVVKSTPMEVEISP